MSNLYTIPYNLIILTIIKGNIALIGSGYLMA